MCESSVRVSVEEKHIFEGNLYEEVSEHPTGLWVDLNKVGDMNSASQENNTGPHSAAGHS